MLLAEASRLGASPTTVTMTGGLYSADGGVDGQTDLPLDASTPFPVGPWSWQLKASSRVNLRDELMKQGVLEDLSDGRNYLVLVSRDLAGRARANLSRDLGSAVREIATGRTGEVLGLEALERFATLHPGVVGRHGGPQVLGMRLEEWARDLDTERFPYTPDAARAEVVERIRSFATSATLPNHIHVFGDTGVGKTRAVFEALAVPGLIERTAANYGSRTGLDSSLAQAAAAGSAPIIVVDDCTSAEEEALRRYAGASKGSLRLITIGDRPGRSVLADSTGLDVMPLEDGTITRLVEQVTDLGPEDARLVTELAQGYPKLAALLAEALATTLDRRSITGLLRQGRLSALLNEMMPDAGVRFDLAHLALVGRLGFEGDLEFEAQQLCAAFEVPYMHFRQSVRGEDERFVSAAGRYRRVSPKALAVWLAQQLMERDPDAFVRRLSGLPEPLFGEFRNQLEMLGGDESFDEILGEVVARRAGTFRTLGNVTVADARLLNAVAYAAPEIAVRVLSAVIAKSNLEDLSLFGGDQRRSFVWALQHLLWFRNTYAPASDALFALATAENETWANNATGALKDSFQVYLGGTEVPLAERIEQLHRGMGRFGSRGLITAADVLSGALQAHETRGANWRGARLQPEEWRPTGAEGRDARRRAIEIFGQIAADDVARSSVATNIGSLLPVVLDSGLARPLAAMIRGVSWSTAERALLSASIRRALYYRESREPDESAELLSLIKELEGEDFESRLTTALSTDYWQLEGSITAATEGSERLNLLAAEATGLPVDELSLLIRSAAQIRESTAFAFGRALGQVDEDGRFRALAESPALPSTFRIGLVSGLVLSNPDWANSLPDRYLNSAELIADLPHLASVLPPSDRLTLLSIQAVQQGGAQKDQLYRFRYGRWIDPISESVFADLLATVAGSDPSSSELEIALGLVDTWLDNPERMLGKNASDLVEGMLAKAAELAGDDRGGMLNFARNRVAARIKQPALNRLRNGLRALQEGAYPSAEDVAAIEDAARQMPHAAAKVAIDFLAAPEWRRFAVEWAHVLSVVARGAGASVVLADVAAREAEERTRLLAHIDFATDTPDPVFVGMLERDFESDEFRNGAMSKFTFPGEVTIGPLSNSLAEKLARATKWSEESNSQAVRNWATDLANALRPRLADQLARETEED
jgi:hypothetical protein